MNKLVFYYIFKIKFFIKVPQQKFLKSMSSSEQSKTETGCDFIDIKIIEVFNYLSQASKFIWSVNSNNILQISSQIIEFITNSKISIQMALYLIDNLSQIRAKEIKLFSEL